MNVQDYFIYLGVSLSEYQEGRTNPTLTKEELMVFNMAEELEKNMRKQQGGGENPESNQEESFQGPPTYETSILGISFKDVSPAFAVVYFLLVVIGICAVLYFSYIQLFGEGPKSQAEKNRLEKKKKKEEKKAKKVE
eukprot:TRINITY_DN2057_c0_g1_i1.p1 TRINITY_DN2057_c0_g1~~TRINITY_DN2057_c0_g1_i1.p1  ORF type:complete len:137 (+),score=48.93 TRINITY_DN2057_c0_g1_i1:866-1276(+)